RAALNGVADRDARVLGSAYEEDWTTTPPERFANPNYSPWQPAMLPGLAFLDGLTVSGAGRRYPDRDFNGSISSVADILATDVDESLNDEEAFALEKPTGLSTPGALIPGLVNINTALPETLKSLPLMNRLPKILPDPGFGAISGVGSTAGWNQLPTPYMRIAEAIEAYRNKSQVGFARSFVNVTNPQVVANSVIPPIGDFFMPTYADRGLDSSAIINSGAIASYPPYTDESQFPAIRDTQGFRADSGFAGISELLLLNRFPAITADQFAPMQEPGLRHTYSIRGFGLDLYDRNQLYYPDIGEPASAWQSSFQAAADQVAIFPNSGSVPYDFQSSNTGYSIGIDRTRGWLSMLPDEVDFARRAATAPPGQPYLRSEFESIPRKYHEPAGDAEDLNMLFKGISNLVTTRSDVFTVYLRVRQVKQDPVTGVWDGSNRELIADDSRYVMCIDRSNVNSPLDQPKILYFQKVQ
ncbi:MAG: hypothetical protein RL325_1879, partial [Planctomycetota bacterium]